MNLVEKIKEILDIEEKIQVKKNIEINSKDIDEQKRIDEFNKICKEKVSSFFIEIQDKLKDVSRAFDDYPGIKISSPKLNDWQINWIMHLNLYGEKHRVQFNIWYSKSGFKFSLKNIDKAKLHFSYTQYIHIKVESELRDKIYNSFDECLSDFINSTKETLVRAKT